MPSVKRDPSKLPGDLACKEVVTLDFCMQLFGLARRLLMSSSVSSVVAIVVGVCVCDIAAERLYLLH